MTAKCDARLRPFPDDTEIRCDATTEKVHMHGGVLRDYAYPGSETTITWHEDDRRNFHGEWPGPCGRLSTCVLPDGHPRGCAE